MKFKNVKQNLKARLGVIDGRCDVAKGVLTLKGFATLGLPSNSKKLVFSSEGIVFGETNSFSAYKIGNDTLCLFRIALPLPIPLLERREISVEIKVDDIELNQSYSKNFRFKIREFGKIIYQDNKDNKKRTLKLHAFNSLKRIKNYLTKFNSLILTYFFWAIIKFPIFTSGKIKKLSHKYSHNIALVIHNLDHPDRPEKLRFFNLVSQNLNTVGFNLVCLHHSKNLPIGIFHFHQFYEFCRVSWLHIGFVRNLYHSNSAEFNETYQLAYDLKKNHQLAMTNMVEHYQVHRDVIHEFLGLAIFLKKHQPTKILLWHQWNSLSVISNFFASSIDIGRFYTHEGFLPGSMALDKNGEIGSSTPNISRDYFSKIPKDRSLKLADSYAKFLLNNSLDRKPQTSSGTEKIIIERCKKGFRGVLFFAGVNDWQTGIFPLDGPYKKEQSPYFLGTYDSLNSVLEIASRQNLLVVFKPHPNTPMLNALSHHNLLIIEHGNIWSLIKECDIVISPVSTVLYHAALAGKPSICMGEFPASLIPGNHKSKNQSELDVQINELLSCNRISRIDVVLHIAILIENYLVSYHEWSEEFHCRGPNDYVREIFKNPID